MSSFATGIRRGRPSTIVRKSEIMALYNLPQPEAARSLGISLSALKNICRRVGISRWPYQRDYLRHRRRTNSSKGPPDGYSTENANSVDHRKPSMNSEPTLQRDEEEPGCSQGQASEFTNHTNDRLCSWSDRFEDCVMGSDDDASHTVVESELDFIDALLTWSKSDGNEYLEYLAKDATSCLDTLTAEHSGRF
jgi:hypothetical protein